MKICSIEGCGREAKGRGWCMNHYMRWKRNGSPTGGGVVPGTGLKWLEETLTVQTDECVYWPFKRSIHGYGTIQFRGKNTGAHRAVCFMAHGEPPSAEHIALHSCARGMQGCVNHRHIRWGTHQENTDDRERDRKTGVTAWDNYHKLSLDDVRQIRSEKGVTQGDVLAKRYGVDRAHISRILSGKARPDRAA